MPTINILFLMYLITNSRVCVCQSKIAVANDLNESYVRNSSDGISYTSLHYQVSEIQTGQGTGDKDNSGNVTEMHENSTVTCNNTEFHQNRTQLEELNKKLFLQAFKRHILSSLQLTNLSDTIDKLPRFPPIYDVALMQADDPTEVEDTFHAKANQAKVFGKDITFQCDMSFNYGCLKFDKLVNVQGVVNSAVLWFYYDAPSNINKMFDITVYSLVQAVKRLSIILKSKKYIDKIPMKHFRPGWKRLTVTTLVQSWMDKPHRNDGIGMRCKLKDRKHRKRGCGRFRQDLFGIKKGYKPYIVLKISLIRPVIKNPICSEGETKCCRKSIIVNFAEIIPHIVRPETVLVNFCMGSCNDPTLTPYNNHTVMIQRYRWNQYSHLNQSLRAIVEPCCSPIAFKDRSVIVANGGVFTKYDIPNFSVTACGCI